MSAAAAAQLGRVVATWIPTMREGFLTVRTWFGEAISMFAELPRECRVSLIHAGSTCAGTPPKYFPVWGWIAIGAVMGLLLGVALAVAAWWMWRVREPQ